MVKKIYILEPKETTPIHLSMPLKVVIYAGIACVILLGIYPQPFIDFSVTATNVFTVGGAVKRLSLLSSLKVTES